MTQRIRFKLINAKTDDAIAHRFCLCPAWCAGIHLHWDKVWPAGWVQDLWRPAYLWCWPEGGWRFSRSSLTSSGFQRVFFFAVFSAVKNERQRKGHHRNYRSANSNIMRAMWTIWHVDFSCRWFPLNGNSSSIARLASKNTIVHLRPHTIDRIHYYSIRECVQYFPFASVTPSLWGGPGIRFHHCSLPEPRTTSRRHRSGPTIRDMLG